MDHAVQLQSIEDTATYKKSDGSQADVQVLTLKSKLGRDVDADGETHARHRWQEVGNNELETLECSADESFTATTTPAHIITGPMLSNSREKLADPGSPGKLKWCVSLLPISTQLNQTLSAMLLTNQPPQPFYGHYAAQYVS